MVSFFGSIVILIACYFIYGKITERAFGTTDRQTPAFTRSDGVDYIPLPAWKAFFIQLLNIAGLGPIFGAITGALWGPAVYLWIVFGTILAGAVHDFFSGMMSVREDGLSIPEVIGRHLGRFMHMVMRIFSLVLLTLTGVVFMVGPAQLLKLLMPGFLSVRIWTVIVLTYYLLATFLPVDKIIGRIYPLFGLLLIIMALAVAGGTIANSGARPMMELTLENLYPGKIDAAAGKATGVLPIWPLMFVSVACGAISGFHSTQSPIVARCIENEKQGRLIFFGAMVAEGIIALIWAAAAIAFFWNGDGAGTGLSALKAAGGGGSKSVFQICNGLLGPVGTVLAVLGVIVCPITSGDTAFRGARMIVFDWFGMDETKIKSRALVAVILLGVGFLISFLDYNIVWRYFSWSNQTLATIVLWTACAFIRKNNSNYKFCLWLTLIPAIFMTAVCSTYLLYAPECFNLGSLGATGAKISNISGIVMAAALLTLFHFKFIKAKKQDLAL
ncbi:MAG TPA: carbon starvation protein A [Spirochaetaceae bacterium]|nr:carbon starvation protein A [Spirochaetaceae bacterium]